MNLKKLQIFFYIAIVLNFFQIKADEFLYPICSIDENNFLVMHQQSLDNLELFIWNNQDNIALKALTSLFMPTNVQMVPDKEEFSFIDRGRIRLKHLKKRTPRTIDIQEPISSIISMKWISSDQFYFVGKMRGFYGVFLCIVNDYSTTIKTLVHCPNQDYLYPCKNKDSLYAVKRNEKNQYFVVKISWQPQEIENFTFPLQTNLYESSSPLCFLQSVENHIFFIDCSLAITENDIVSFSYWDINKENEVSKLFSFDLKKGYILGESDTRIYESILPFLPEYCEQTNSIYYINHGNNQGSLYQYTIDDKKNINIQLNDSTLYLSPKLKNSRGYPGLILPANCKKQVRYNFDNGITTLMIPSFNL